MADSFAKYRWCSNIIGPQSGGAVENLPLYQFEQSGEIQTKIPTEVLISERREYELAEEGFIALTMRKGSDNAAFFSSELRAASEGLPEHAGGQGGRDELQALDAAALYDDNEPLAHYIKVIQRENIGGWKERADIERELERMDQPVRHGDGQSRRDYAQQAPAP